LRIFCASLDFIPILAYTSHISRLRMLMDRISQTSLPFQIFFASLALYFTSIHSYILFHSLVEVSTSVVAFGIFVIAWASRRYVSNNFLLIIGVGYFFVGGFDLLHMLSYVGMGVFDSHDPNIATQLWIAARYLEAASFVAAFFFFSEKKQQKIQENMIKIILSFAVVFFAVLASIFYWKNFPVAYHPGTGLTEFKKMSEYVISFLFLMSIFLLYRKRKLFDREMAGLLFIALIVKIISEIFFTEYVGISDFSNMLGHLFKFISFVLLYKAVLEGGLMRPYRFMFRDLKKSEETLRSSQARCQAILENHTELLCRFKPEGELTFVNSAYCRYFGKSKSELIGHDFAPVPYDEDKLKVEECINSLTPAAPVRELEYRISLPDGEIRWHRWNLSGIFNRFGRIIEYQSLRQDITEKKRAEEEIAKIQSERTRSMENQLVKSYEYLGMVNRRMSLLLDIETHSMEVSKKNRQKIADYILNSALNLSRASAGLLYKCNKENGFQLVSKGGSLGKSERVMQTVVIEQIPFLNNLIKEKKRINGPYATFEFDGFIENSGVDYVVFLPFFEKSECTGLLFLGFENMKSMDVQELEFLDVFAFHVSHALSRAGVFGS